MLFIFCLYKLWLLWEDSYLKLLVMLESKLMIILFIFLYLLLISQFFIILDILEITKNH
jgi:hypothetical protein